jgi:hypothetical protein
VIIEYIREANPVRKYLITVMVAERLNVRAHIRALAKEGPWAEAPEDWQAGSCIPSRPFSKGSSPGGSLRGRGRALRGMTSKRSMTGPLLAQLSAARRAAVIRLRVDLGLSSGAIARLSIEDVDRQGRKLWIRRRGLEKESRSIPEGTLAALEVWLEVRRTVASVGETALFVMLSGQSRGQRMSGYNFLRVGHGVSSS